MTQLRKRTTRKTALFTALLVGALASKAPASDLYVDDDGQQCPYPSYSSIQEAVDNSWPGDFIYIYSGTYTGSGDEVVEISVINQSWPIDAYNLELIGVGNAVIDGEGQRRCVRAKGPTDNKGPITLRNLTLANGNAKNGSGGGLHATGNVHLDICTVVDCTADNSGGGIVVIPPSNYLAGERSAVHMVGTTVQFCAADDDGGGIYCKGNSSLMMESCWILQNFAGRNGGGIAAAGGGTYGSVRILNYDSALDPCDLLQGLVIPGSSVSGNRCMQSGGGIYMKAHPLELMVGEVLNNRAGVSGGGISISNAEIWLASWRGPVLIGQNVVGEAPGDTVGNGGGLYAVNSTVKSNLFSAGVPNTVTFFGNVAYARGGGVFAKDCDQIKLEQSVFEQNRAYGKGGGMLVNSCDELEIKASSFLYNVGGVAGALLIKDDGSGTYDIDSTSLHHNIGVMNGGANGGALVVSGSGASAEITGCDFNQNLKRHIMAIAGASLVDGGMNSFY
jgi:predicted outer membrane repeat protein